MTVTQVFDTYLEIMFSSSGERPAIGDLVEPMASPGAPAPAPLPSDSLPSAFPRSTATH